MIVRKDSAGTQWLVGQTDHSRLAGQFAAHWGNAAFAPLTPFESVVRAATFHDFGYLRYETAPAFDATRGETPNFRDVVTDTKRLDEYAWCFDWLLAPDPYAANLVSTHRTGLWRARYDAIAFPAQARRTQTPEIDAFVAEHEARRATSIADHGWNEQQIRINYRLLQVWDLLSLYFSCQSPADDHIEPVPVTYAAGEGEGVRIALHPIDATTISVSPYPFDRSPLTVTLAARRMRQTVFDDRDAFVKAFVQAPVELLEFHLVDGSRG